IANNDETKRILKDIENGKSFLVDGIDFSNQKPIKIGYAPVSVGNSKSPWSVGIAMPLTILDELNQYKWFSIIVGIVVLVIIGGIIISVVIRVIVRPLKEITGYADQIVEGDFDFNIDINRKDEVGLLANSFKAVQETSENLSKLIAKIYENYSKGDLEAKVETDKFRGEWKELIENIFKSFDAVILPVREGIRVLTKVKGGDLRENMGMELKGDFNHLKDAINELHSWLLSLIDFSNKIANGNMSANIEKASDDDQIHEWLILMKNNVGHIVSEVNKFADLSVKGDFDNIKFNTEGAKGVFADIFENLNKTVEAIKEPLSEVNEVMDRMANKDLTVKVEGDYEGLYKKMKERINGFADAINGALSKVSSSTDPACSVALLLRF
ncbi:MAG: hypothetical protein CSA15_01255, partial [Candidatus Delongbacteria bacterium]